MSKALPVVDDLLEILRSALSSVEEPSGLPPSIGIERRESLRNALKKRGSAQNVMRNPNVAASLSSAASTLETHQRRKHLQQDFDARRAPEDLVDQGVLYSDKMAAKVQPVAHDLEEQLKIRVDDKYLVKEGVLRTPTLSNVLAPAAYELEKAKHKDAQRSADSPLPRGDSRRNMFNIAPTLASTAATLEKKKLEERVHALYNARREPSDLVDAGLIYSLDIAHSLQRTAFDLEELIRTRVGEEYLTKQRILKNPQLATSLQPQGDKVQKTLAERPPRADVVPNPQVAPALAESLHRLEKTKRQESMKTVLGTRPSAEDLADSGILYSTQLGASLQPAAMQLEEQLRERPDESYLVKQKHIMQKSGLSISLQGTAAELDHQMRKDHEYNMGTPVETRIAPMLQTQAKSLDSKMKRARLEDHLMRRPSVTGLVDSEMVYSETMASGLQGRAMTLESMLGNRLSKSELLHSGLMPHSQLPELLQGVAQDLERALERVEHAETAGHIKAAQLKIAPALQGIARQLEKQQKRDQTKQDLETNLGTRPDAGDVLGDVGKVAPAIAGAAKKMEQLQRRASLSSKLATRPDEADLKAKLIVKDTKLAASLQPISVKLEHTMEQTKDTNSPIPKASNLAPALASAGKSLEHAQRRDSVKHSLANRPDPDAAISAGLIYSLEMAQSLQRYARELEEQLRLRVAEEFLRSKGLVEYPTLDSSLRAKASGLEESLGSRPAVGDVLADPTVAPSIASITRTVDNLQKQHRLSREMARPRPDAADVLGEMSRIAPSIAGAAKQVKQHMTSKSLSSKLEERPSLDIITEAGVFYSKDMASSIQPTAVDLEDQLTHRADRSSLDETGVLQNPKLDSTLQPAGADLGKALASRPDRSDVVRHSDVAPALTGAVRAVEKQMKTKNLSTKLDKRKSLDDTPVYSQTMAAAIQPASHSISDKVADRGNVDLADRGLIQNPKLASSLQPTGADVSTLLEKRPDKKEDKIAPAISGTVKTMERKVKSDSLSRQLDKRPDSEAVDSKVFYSQQMDPSIQPSAHDLQGLLGARQQLDELLQKGLMPFAHLPSYLRPTAADLEKALVRAQVAGRAAPSSIAPSLQSAAQELERHQRRQSLSKSLDSRPDAKDVLGDRDNVAASLQPTAYAVESQLKRHALSSALEKRPTASDVSKEGILYSEELASSLQPVASGLEQWWRGRVSAEFLAQRGIFKEEPRITELPNELSSNIDMASPTEMIRILRQCDAQIFAGWHEGASLYDFQPIIALVAHHAQNILSDSKNNKIVLSGCGTSGRLAFLASRMFNDALVALKLTPCVEYSIAGGDTALFTSKEFPEDDPQMGVTDLLKLTKGAKQVLLIGITCGLSAPYVGGQLEYAMKQDNFVTVCVGFNPAKQARNQPVEKWEGQTFLKTATALNAVSPKPDVPESMKFDDQKETELPRHILLNPVVGPETITGSSRMKGGSATKILLDTIFITALAKVGDTDKKLDRSDIVYEVLTAFEAVMRDSYKSSIVDGLGKTIDAAFEALHNNGRVFYIGRDDATSIVSFIDASEMLPTFGTSLDQFRAYFPHGWGLLKNREGDLSKKDAQFVTDVKDLDLSGLTAKDLVVYLNDAPSAILQPLQKSKANLAHLWSSFEKDKTSLSRFERSVDLKLHAAHSLTSQVSPVLNQLYHDSLRMFSLKLLLNAVSTGAHVRNGLVYSNRMVNLRVANDKLFYRSVNLIQEFAHVSFSLGRQCLLRAIYGDSVWIEKEKLPVSEHLKVATKMDRVVPIGIILGVYSQSMAERSVDEVKQMLQTQPTIRKVLQSILTK